MINILLVEDDLTLAAAIEYTLQNEGFKTVTAHNIKDSKVHLSSGEFDLILLDVLLPDGSGYELRQWIRQQSNVPIIFLTACDQEVNVVMGLDIGGDDYIIKPFRIRELISRIKAVLRRNVEATVEKNHKFISGKLRVELLKGKVFKDNQEVLVTSMEYRLLLKLLKNSGQILSRTSLLETLWDTGGEFVDDNTLSVYIKRLREKVEDNQAEPKYIVTVRGIGYRWDVEVRGEI